MRSSKVCGAFVVVGILAMSLAGSAQDRSSDEVYARAIHLRDRHHDARALALLRAHFEATHEPRALASMGLAEMALRSWAAAEHDLAAALAMTPTPWINEHRATLEVSLQQCRAQLGLAALLVQTEAPGAEVFVNNARVGAAGETIRVGAGPLTFEVRAPGRRPVSRSVAVAPGATQAEQVTLVAQVSDLTPTSAPAPPPPSPAPTPTPTIVVSMSPPPATAPPTRDEAPGGGSQVSSGTLSILAWSSAGASALLLGAGAGTYVAGQSAADQYNSDACLAVDRNRVEVCPGERSTASTMGVLATVGFVTGGALALTSAVLFAVSTPSRSSSRAGLRCGLGFNGSITCGGVF